MTTDKLPEVKDEATSSVGPSIHSSAEEAIKKSAMDSESKPGRKIKFAAKSKGAKASLIAAAFLGIIVLLLIVVMMAGGGSAPKGDSSPTVSPVELKDLEPDNNSSGYSQSPTANFGNYSLNLDLNQPALLKSASYEGKIGDQISWDNGFVILVASVDRDYRPASEFNYKKIAEAGGELVRVNMLVGNASNANMPIGYNDLALYASALGMENTESERFSEDTYSPKDGELLGAKKTQKISLHYRVKRDQQFEIIKIKTFDQKTAKPKKGEEKTPTLSLRIVL